MQSVKNMPRKQQKAVFANMGDGSHLRLENTATYQRRRDYLIRKHELSEDTEDKIFRVMDNPRLTHRQKMAQVTEIKKKALQKLKGARGPDQSVVSTVHVATTFEPKKKKAVTITQVPEGIGKPAFNAILAREKLSKANLYNKDGLLLTQTEYNQAIVNARTMPKDAKIITQPVGTNREAFDAVMYKKAVGDSKTYVNIDGFYIKASVYRKALRRNARVRYNVRDWKAKHRQEVSETIKETKKTHEQKGIRQPAIAGVFEQALDKKKKVPLIDAPTTKQNIASAKKDIKKAHVKRTEKQKSRMQGRKFLYKDAFGTKGEAERVKTTLEKEGKKNVSVFTDKEGDWNISYNNNWQIFAPKTLKKKTYKQLKRSGVHLKPKADADRDGVSNKKDCRPLDKTKQDRGRKMTVSKAFGRAVGGYMQSRTPEGRLKAARARSRLIETKRRAVIAEQKAKKAEQDYAREHPSFIARTRAKIAERRRKKSIYE